MRKGQKLNDRLIEVRMILFNFIIISIDNSFVSKFTLTLSYILTILIYKEFTLIMVNGPVAYFETVASFSILLCCSEWEVKFY